MTGWVAFISVGVGVCASQRIHFVRFGATHTKGDYLRDQKKTREGRSQRTGQSAGETSPQNRVVDRSWRKLTVEKGDYKGLCTQRPGWPMWEDGSAFLVTVGISLKYTLALAHRCTESYTKVSQTSPFLRLELTQARVCLFSFLPPTRLCMLCFGCP